MSSRGARERVVEGRTPLRTDVPAMTNRAIVRDKREHDRSVQRASVPAVGWKVLAANRLGFGPGPSFETNWATIPGSGEQKFDNYVRQQLFPVNPGGGIPPVNDAVFEGEKSDAGFTTINLSHQDLWQNFAVGPGNRNRPVEEIEKLTWMRAVYSKKQLQEVLADFWHNHFNVRGWDHWSRPVWPSWDRLLRQNMLGNFRDMVRLTARHSAMLYYLDQYTSSNERPNENYARELIELHTVGAEHYMGVRSQSEVPLGSDGKPVAYVDGDVFDLALALTGWSVRNSSSTGNTGLFYFNVDWHDVHANKVVMGLELGRAGGVEQGEQAIDRLSYHRSTAHHIAKKLCIRLISDDPSFTIVDAAADLFHAQRFAPDQLRQVVELICTSQEFKSTWGEKTKRPFEITAGALRAPKAIFPFQDDNGVFNDDLGSFFNRYEDAGQPLFGWPTPDGFPDQSPEWQSSLPRIQSWNTTNWLSSIHTGGAFIPRFDVATETPSQYTTATEIADYWIDRILYRSMTPADRDIVVNLLGGGNPNANIDLNDDDDNALVRTTVALILNSAYFIER